MGDATMKRIIFLSIALLSSAFLAADHKMDYSKTVAEYIKEVQGQEITEPKELVKEWIALKADKFKLAADEVENALKYIKNEKERAAAQDIAATLRDLAQKYHVAPLPQEDMTKKLANESKWLELAARMKQLKAKKYRLIGEQLNSKAALKLSRRMEKAADAINRALEYAQASEIDLDNDLDIDNDED
jgi:hypothetical protein